MNKQEDEKWMAHALMLAQQAAELGEVPVGAVLVRDGEAIGEGFNQPISSHDPSAHAEICALRDAGKRAQNYRLPGSTLYVTIEPCTMCFGALVHSRVERLVFGAREPKAGVFASHPLPQGIYNHTLEWEGGVLEARCSAVMQEFFKNRREHKKTLKQALQVLPGSDIDA